MRSLVDTNILLYRYDPADRHKRAVAHEVLREGFDSLSLVLAHQSIIELVAAARRLRTWPDGDRRPLLTTAEISREVDYLFQTAPILWPTKDTVRLALRGMAAYQLSWWDAHLWAYAEENLVDEILSEDFQHGRFYGDVRVINPFLAQPETVHQEVGAYDADWHARRGR